MASVTIVEDAGHLVSTMSTDACEGAEGLSVSQVVQEYPIEAAEVMWNIISRASRSTTSSKL